MKVGLYTASFAAPGHMNKTYVKSSSAKANHTTLKNLSLTDKILLQQGVKVLPGVSKVSFGGYRVFIVDGGNHSTNMEHFAKAISTQMEPLIKPVKTLLNNPNMKYLKDLKEVLTGLRLSNENLTGQYVAIPASSNVPLLNLRDQVKAVMGKDVYFTPENIKAHKPLLMDFLKKIYYEPEPYRRFIGYMDREGQGLEHTYGVIEEINKLINDKNARVFIPSGHPFDATMKWMAGERNLKPELYNFIATGRDDTGVVRSMQNEIKNNNWYDFNLLSLSDANVITIKNKGWNKDYVFASFDTCATDGARGVYNFSPVRDKNKNLIGYSYTDTVSNQYPFVEFPANDEVANLAKYVGFDAKDMIANRTEIDAFKAASKNKAYDSYSYLSDKLYPIEEIFTQKEIQEKKLRLKGDYVDSSKNYFSEKILTII